MYDRDGSDRGNELRQLEQEQQKNVQRLAQKQREFQMLMNLQPEKVHKFKIKSQNNQQPYQNHFARFDSARNESQRQPSARNSNIFEISSRDPRKEKEPRRLESPKETSLNDFSRFKAEFQQNKEIQEDFKLSKTSFKQANEQDKQNPPLTNKSHRTEISFNEQANQKDVAEAREELIQNYGKRKANLGGFSRKSRWLKDELWS